MHAPARIVLASVAILAVAAFMRPSQEMPVLAITNVTVIDADGTPPAIRNVVVRGERIESIAQPSSPVPAGARVVDGAGKFLIPGLWDMHVHLATSPKPRVAEEVMLPAFLKHGVVGVRDMGGPLERLVELRGWVVSQTVPGPRIWTSGPFIDGPADEEPMFRRPRTEADARFYVRALSEMGVDFIKVQAMLAPDIHRVVIDEAHRRGLAVAGHVPLSMTTEDVLYVGQRSVEHISPALVGDGAVLFDCSGKRDELRRELRAIEHDRRPDNRDAIRAREAALRSQLVSTFDRERCRALGTRFKSAGAWLVPTLVWSNSRRIPDADVVRKTAATAVLELHRGGASILAGTDTLDTGVPPGESLHQELALLVEAGLTPLEALQTATRNAAAYRAALHREGTIAVGKLADLVLLAKNPLDDIRNISTVASVIQEGAVR